MYSCITVCGQEDSSPIKITSQCLQWFKIHATHARRSQNERTNEGRKAVPNDSRLAKVLPYSRGFHLESMSWPAMRLWAPQPSRKKPWRMSVSGIGQSSRGWDKPVHITRPNFSNNINHHHQGRRNLLPDLCSTLWIHWPGENRFEKWVTRWNRGRRSLAGNISEIMMIDYG